MINETINNLRKTINLYKEKPHLPFWGEIFCILQNLKNEIDKNSESIFLYETTQSVTVFYRPNDCRFRISLPDFNMLLTQEEFIDNILQGKFWPR